jgi:membrane fusion protein (multidrug efflux system)
LNWKEARKMAENEQKAARNEKEWKKHKIALVFAAIAVVLGAIYGIKYLHYILSYQSTDDAFVEAHVAAISPRVAGHVLKVYVDDNQSVKTGDLLAELDPADYQAKLDSEKASLEAARAAAQQSRAQIIAAQAVAQRTGIDLKRYEQLVASDSATKQRLDYAAADAKAANAQLEAANKQAATAEAKVAEEEAKVQQAQLNLSYTKIHAPLDGKVTNKSVEVGEYVTVGQPLMAIVENKPWVVANYKETQLRHMEVGQKATISVDAYPDKKLQAHVDSIQAGTGARFSLLPPENATGNYVKVVQRVPVKIVFDEDPNVLSRLAPGMSVVPEVRVRKD